MAARATVSPSHQRGPSWPVRRARLVAGLAAGAVRASAGHGRRLDPGCRTVLAAAPVRDGALDGERRLELRRSGAARLVVASPAASPAMADRQYRLPSRAPSQSARAELPAARGPWGRAGGLPGAAPPPPRRPAGAAVDAVGRGGGQARALPLCPTARPPAAALPACFFSVEYVLAG